MQNADPLDGIDRNWDFFIACFGSGRDACEKTGTACGGGSSRRVRSSFGCEFALWFHRGFSFNEPIGAGGVLCSRDSGSNNAFVPEPSGVGLILHTILQITQILQEASVYKQEPLIFKCYINLIKKYK